MLKDINLEVEPGGTVGLIGVNGSGKSTLLKCISRAMYQTAGRCETYGRHRSPARGPWRDPPPAERPGEHLHVRQRPRTVARRQLAERFDTIVEFAEVADAIDRQVKFYSSGMQVRLGFSIASHLDADILLVDEVLAVGDANFQQKCLRRISEVVANGTTLLFVSHDLAAVEAICERAMWLNDAVVRASGPTRDVLDQYRGSIEEQAVMTSNPPPAARAQGRGRRARRRRPALGARTPPSRLVLSAPEGGAARFFVGVSQGTAMPIFVARQYHKFPGRRLRAAVPPQERPSPQGRLLRSGWP